MIGPGITPNKIIKIVKESIVILGSTEILKTFNLDEVFKYITLITRK